MVLLQDAGRSRQEQGHAPPRELFLKALTPIRSFASKRAFPKPELVEDRPAQLAARGMRM